MSRHLLGSAVPGTGGRPHISEGGLSPIVPMGKLRLRKNEIQAWRQWAQSGSLTVSPASSPNTIEPCLVLEDLDAERHGEAQVAVPTSREGARRDTLFLRYVREQGGTYHSGCRGSVPSRVLGPPGAVCCPQGPSLIDPRMRTAGSHGPENVPMGITGPHLFTED